jgi:hypothetical protein
MARTVAELEGKEIKEIPLTQEEAMRIVSDSVRIARTSVGPRCENAHGQMNAFNDMYIGLLRSGQ